MAKEHNIWMSVSDLMTGLMVIFLFVAIAYISRVQQHAVNLKEYVEVKQKLHGKMVTTFKGDTERWQMAIGSDLSIKFQNAQTLFPSGSDELTPEFKHILDEFLPKYFGLLLNDSLSSHITEIRVEGHTDTVPYPKIDPKDPYMANLILSQQRARNVLRHFRSMKYYQTLSEGQKHLLEYWFTANGLSYGKALDKSGELAFDSKEQIDKDKSRRVEFRIITDSEKLLENFVKGSASENDSTRLKE